MTDIYGLISVSDKTNLEVCGRHLAAAGVKLLATGGTARYLKDKGFAVQSVDDLTGFPEILGGRVKTLHPKIYGSLLARRDREDHRSDMEAHQLADIRYVVVNLYPFSETVGREGTTLDECIEQIDIGGVSLIRGGAKNYRDIAVITDPEDYALLADPSQLDEPTRRKLALKGWRHVAQYDKAIYRYFHREWTDEVERDDVPEGQNLDLVKTQSLVYGENPHQKGGYYQSTSQRDGSPFEIINDRPLSYNNFLDVSAALSSVSPWSQEAAVVVKHTNPCGVAVASSLPEALEMAWQGDSKSAFGSIIAVNRPLTLDEKPFFKGKFIEAVCAPGFALEMVEYFTKKKKRIRLVQYDPHLVREHCETTPQWRTVLGGYLCQDPDHQPYQKWEVVTKTPFPETLVEVAQFGVVVNRMVTSNAISLVSRWKGVLWHSGMGAGQPNRVGALENLALPLFYRNARELAGEGESAEDLVGELKSCTVLISDAFFPFPDTVEIAAAEGIKYVVQPGGSRRDDQVIEACNQLGVAMVFTGTRHFRH